MMDPTIHNELYQQGRMYEFENVKAYVLAKFHYTCPICGHKFDKEHKARLHHITMCKNGATDNPDEYLPICEKCHTPEAHAAGEKLDILAKQCRRKEYREPTFMNILRKQLTEGFPEAEITYGNITNADRKHFRLDKTHANDASAIGGHTFESLEVCKETVYYKQIRRKKRSLHEATPRKGRKTPNRTAKRNDKNVNEVNGFCLYDTVLFDNKKCYIKGFTGKSVYLVDFAGNYIQPETQRYKQVSLSKIKRLEQRTSNYLMKVG